MLQVFESDSKTCNIVSRVLLVLVRVSPPPLTFNATSSRANSLINWWYTPLSSLRLIQLLVQKIRSRFLPFSSSKSSTRTLMIFSRHLLNSLSTIFVEQEPGFKCCEQCCVRAAATRAIFVSRQWCDFFQILSRRLRARVATLVTNFGDKLKAAPIAYFKRPGHHKKTFLL